MGQTASNESSKSGDILESFTKQEVQQLFNARCLLLFKSIELQAVASKLNITNIKEKSIITTSDLAYLCQLSNDKSEHNDQISFQFKQVINLLYNSFQVIGKFPFLRDYDLEKDSGLSVEELLVACIFHSGRYKKIFNKEFDYIKLLFISLALGDPENVNKESNKTSKSEFSEQQTTIGDESEIESFTLELNSSFGEEDPLNIRSRKIRWDSFKLIKTFDEIDIEPLTINANSLLLLLTLFLIITSIPKMNHDKMYDQLISGVKERWSEYESNAFVLLKYFKLSISHHNIKSESINFSEFKRTIDNLLPKFFHEAFSSLFKHGFLSSLISQPTGKPSAAEIETSESEESSTSKSKKSISAKFVESRLVNLPSISLIGTILTNQGSNINISNKNLVKLYAGSESGFSIRSLESKIFKWQAPTLFIVSGKRLRNKTLTSNMRYQSFKTEYPQFFRSSENSLREWQSDHDKITYCVLVHQPWRNSNKRNFGDEESLIFSISPRVDVYKSTHNPILKGESIYFNNLGLGLGFGNDQPVNKNGVKKYLPGEVSLTIEANLEFAVFRHVSTSSAQSINFFHKSNQESIQLTDFEDRFMITDLEVWGVGSTKELEEQRKQWEWEEKQAEARQSVNLRSLGEERAFLEMVGLVGNHNSTGGSV
ncbi:restriction of telomere capping protein 5 [Scheffersomyces amazonensis]|uniref:restriction of telomere capping protein 5 n=1 Tax=Scheffersomyces amazonensis TaxID=1078765 RepID=UPI00315D40FD